ncbi:hypothetical protein D3C73_815810 [compost metagenome]
MLHNRFQQKVWIIVKEMSAISSPPPGRSTTVKAINGQLKTLQQQLDTLIASEMPLLVKLKGDLYQQQARQYIGDYLASVRSGVSQRITAMNNIERVPNLATFGGLVALLNLWNLTVVIDGAAQNAKSVGQSRASMQLGSALAWTGNAIAALYQGAVWGEIKQLRAGEKALTSISIKNASIGEHAAVVKSFSLRMLALSSLGIVAAGLEAWDSALASQDPLISGIEKSLLVAKTIVLGGQAAIFGAQTFIALGSMGGTSITIGAVFAPWMIISLFVLGFAYLFLVMLLNIFKRSELEKWLLQSTWGRQPANWSAEDELARFELLVNKPGASLTVVRSKPQGWMDTGRPQWQLQLSLPTHLRGQTIGLNVTSQPLASAGQMIPARSKQELDRYLAAMKPKMIDTLRGRWDDMVYSLPLGVDTNSAIKLELGYLGGMIQREFIFKGSSSSSGPVTLNGDSGELDTMSALVVGNRENK